MLTKLPSMNAKLIETLNRPESSSKEVVSANNVNSLCPKKDRKKYYNNKTRICWNN